MNSLETEICNYENMKCLFLKCPTSYCFKMNRYLDVLNFSMLKPMVGTMSCAWA